MGDEFGPAAGKAVGWASQAGSYFWLGVYGLIFVVVVGVVVLVWREAISRRIVIESFTVPKNLEELGWSGAVIAHQLMDEISRVHRQGRSSKEQEEFQRPGAAREYVTVSAGGMAISYLSLVGALRQLFKLGESRLAGELLIRAEDSTTPSRAITLVCRFQRSSGGSFSRWLRLRSSTYSRFPLWGRNSHKELIRRRNLLVS
jgi:hypothetical protein